MCFKSWPPARASSIISYAATVLLIRIHRLFTTLSEHHHFASQINAVEQKVRPGDLESRTKSAPFRRPDGGRLVLRVLFSFVLGLRPGRLQQLAMSEL